MKLYFFRTAPLLGFLALTSCSKTTDVPCDCPPLEVKPGLLVYPTTGPDLSYARPVFNPSNPQELAFLKGSRSETRTDPATITGLWTMSLATRQQQRVRAGHDMLLQVRWNASGWLALSKNDQIWKVKANGDSLTQLTFGTKHYQPQWSPDGQSLACALSGDGSANQHLVLLDKNGTRVPTPGLESRAGYAHGWSPDGKLLLIDLANDAGQQGLGTYDFKTGQAQFLVAYKPTSEGVGNSCYGAAWLPDSQSFLWCTGQGIYRTNVANGNTMLLRTGCLSRTYLHPSVSADGRQFVVERTDQRGVEDGTKIHTETALWRLDIDGRNERKVQF